MVRSSFLRKYFHIGKTLVVKLISGSKEGREQYPDPT